MVENQRSIVSQLQNSDDVAEWEKVCIPFIYVPEVHLPHDRHFFP